MFKRCAKDVILKTSRLPGFVILAGVLISSPAALAQPILAVEVAVSDGSPSLLDERSEQSERLNGAAEGRG